MFVSADRSLFFPFCHSLLPGKRARRMECCDSFLQTCAYRPEVLREITALPQGKLEKAESLEQLRWLENGYKIAVRFTDHESVGIDTPEDLERVRKISETSDLWSAKY